MGCSSVELEGDIGRVEIVAPNDDQVFSLCCGYGDVVVTNVSISVE
jgi:hypothetical protein